MIVFLLVCVATIYEKNKHLLVFFVFSYFRAFVLSCFRDKVLSLSGLPRLSYNNQLQANSYKLIVYHP